MTKNELKLRTFEAVLAAYVQKDELSKYPSDIVFNAQKMAAAVADSLWRDER
jgi:hypothetical protein